MKSCSFSLCLDTIFRLRSKLCWKAILRQGTISPGAIFCPDEIYSMDDNGVTDREMDKLDKVESGVTPARLRFFHKTDKFLKNLPGLSHFHRRWSKRQGQGAGRLQSVGEEWRHRLCHRHWKGNFPRGSHSHCRHRWQGIGSGEFCRHLGNYQYPVEESL